MDTPARSMVLNCLVKRISSAALTGFNQFLNLEKPMAAEPPPTGLTLVGINPRPRIMLFTVSMESASTTSVTVAPDSLIA